jgi:hypothetical protein
MDSDRVFTNYPIFIYLKMFNIFGRKRFADKSLFFTLLFGVLFVIASFFDRTLFMGDKNIGLFEHPTIWSFIILQAIIPYSISKTINGFYRLLNNNEIFDPKEKLSEYIQIVNKQTLLQTNISRFFYSSFVAIGLICFIWNSYQNQLPYTFVGFDYWDSFYHPLGYWITRVYKFYLWVFFLPTLIHIQLVLLYTLNCLLKNAIKEKFIILKPYHQDGYGGTGIIIKTLINPLIPILLVTVLSVVSVLLIHHKLGATPIIGLFVICLLLITIYLIPALSLNNIIKSEKKRQLEEINHTQDLIYLSLINNKEKNTISSDAETLDALSKVALQIKSISNWPYIKLVAELVGIINIPALSHFIYQVILKK